VFTIHAGTLEGAEAARESLRKSLSYSNRRVRPLPLFYRTIRS
jgi:hypothetical protein